METKYSTMWSLGLVSLLVLRALAADEIHTCERECVEGISKSCFYNWTLEHYVTLSVDCGNCPYQQDDCFGVGCIPANGVQRMITVINRQMPGPPINVCQGDKIIVRLCVLSGAEVCTIHWHGMSQVGTPFMDGVPMVTQCPIIPFDCFQYEFEAAEKGTFFYHSHVGFQRTDGLNGMLVVRQPKGNDPNKALYDHDLPAHQIMLSDWINKTGEDMFREFYQSKVDYTEFLTTILVNGHGRLLEIRNTTTGEIFFTPYSSFVVKQGLRYRFRICSNANFICPMQVSVVDHPLLVVGTDGDSIKPVLVDALVINPGERFDFVINATQPIATYWMLFRGLLRCEIMNTVGRAILKYETAVDVEPPEPNGAPPTRVLNPVNDPFTSNSQVSLLELESYTPPDKAITRVTPDTQIYLPFNLYPNLNPEFTSVDALLPMVNSIAFLAPPSPLLSQFYDIPKNVLCIDPNPNGRRNCSADFCHCTYILRVQIGWVVEIILIDVGPTEQPGVNHPWHLHGQPFWYIGGDFMLGNNTVAIIKAMDKAGKIKRNLKRPVQKDTVSVPHGGYTIIRFHATNIGFWAFHCHVELHTETGMMLVIQVGDLGTFPKPPSNFPRCGNFRPKKSPFPKYTKPFTAG